MADPDLWSRLKKARLVRVLLLYLGASWGVLEVADVLVDALSLPGWVTPVALILLLVGLVVILATAWIQSHPLVEAREEADEVPGDWEVHLGDAVAALTRGEMPHPTWARALVGGIFVFSILFGVAGLYVVVQDRGESFQPGPAYAGEAAPALAVLPFRVTGEGHEDWREGMVDLLSTGLDGAAGLRAVDSRTVLARWDRMVEDGDRPDLPASLEVARATGARFALEGSVISIGDDVRLVARIHDLETGRRLGQRQVEGSFESPHGLVDRLSLEVLEVLLGGEAADLPQVDLAAVTTTSTEALKDFLDGERHFRRGRFEEAIEAYRSALAEDSTFALAHHHLGLALGWSASAELADRHRARVIELSHRLPERERLIVTGYSRATRRDPAGLDSLEQAVETYPDDPEAWYLLGETYYHQPAHVGPERMEQAFARAVELDPDFAPYRIHHVDMAFRYHGDSAVAARRVEEYRRVADPDDEFLREFEIDLGLVFGDSATRAAVRDSLPGLELDILRGVSAHLGHPRTLDAEETVLREGLSRHAEAEVPAGLVRDLVGNLLDQGRGREALELAEHPALSGPDRQCIVAEMAFFGFPVDRNRLRDAVGDPGASSASFGEAICGATVAADVGLPDAYEAGRKRMIELADEAAARGDTVQARESRAQTSLVDGYWSWRAEGRLEEAARLLEEADDVIGGAPAYWLGEIYRALGRLDDAEEAYRVQFDLPHAWYRLAGIYEERGDRAKARDAWRRVAVAWEDADPPFRERAEEARSRLAALAEE